MCSKYSVCAASPNCTLLQEEFKEVSQQKFGKHWLRSTDQQNPEMTQEVNGLES